METSLHLHGVMLPAGETRDVYVRGDSLTFEPQPDAETVLDSGYLVPGLVDAHTHLQLESPRTGSPEEMARGSAEVEIEAGVLALREPGAPFGPGSQGIGPEQGLPRVVTAGEPLAPAGQYFYGRDTSDAELTDAALDEHRKSGLWVKIIGDMPGDDGIIRPFYQPASVAAATEAVHREGGRVAVHAIVPEVLRMAIEAGVDSIEHGIFMDADMVDGMAERGITWVPTLIIDDAVRGTLESMGSPQNEITRVDEALRRQPSIVRLAVERGVRVLAGTDAGMVPHGLIAEEIGLLVRAGLNGEDALAAGSWLGREFLDLPGIEEGAPADLVAYADDPRSDLEVLRHPVLRMVAGRLLS